MREAKSYLAASLTGTVQSPRPLLLPLGWEWSFYRAGPHAEFQESASSLLLRVYHLKRGLAEFVWDVWLKIEKKKKSMCYWEMHFQIHHSATPSLRLILSPCPGTCHRESQRTGFPADIKILPFSWQIRENLFSEADTSSLVYRSLICWWVCRRAFTKLHPCFS